MEDESPDIPTSYPAITSYKTDDIDNAPMEHDDFWSMENYARKTKPILNPIHAYFVYDDNSGFSFCRVCPEKIKGRWTSNLKRHISAKHADCYTHFLNHLAEKSAKEPVTPSGTNNNNNTSSGQVASGLTVDKKDDVQQALLLNSIQTRRSSGGGNIYAKFRDWTEENDSSNQDEGDESEEADSLVLLDVSQSKRKSQIGRPPKKRPNDESTHDNYSDLAEITNAKPRGSSKLKTNGSHNHHSHQDTRKKFYDEKTKSIIQAFIYNSLPSRLMDESSFKRMLNVVSNGSMLITPTGRQLDHCIKHLADQLKTKILQKLQKTRYISLAVRHLSCPDLSNRNETDLSQIGAKVLAVTCHFFDKEAEVTRQYLLSCRVLPKLNNPNDQLFTFFSEILEDWDIDENKIYRIMTDNGFETVKLIQENLAKCRKERIANNDNVSSTIFHNNPVDLNNMATLNGHVTKMENFDDFECRIPEFEAAEMALNSFFINKRLSCFPNDLIIIIQKAVGNVSFEEFRAKVFKLINNIEIWPEAREVLNSKTNGIGLIGPRSPLWVHWFYVFERLLKVKKEIIEVCNEMSIINDFGDNDWQFVQGYTDIFRPVVLTIMNFETEEKCITLSALYPILYGLTSKLQKLASHNQALVNVAINKITTEMQKSLAKIMNTCNVNFDPVYALATFLDPRYCLLLKDDLLDKAKQELHRMAQLFLNSKTETGLISDSLTDKIDANNGPANDPGDNINDILYEARAVVAKKRRIQSAFASGGDSMMTSFLNLEMQIYDAELQTVRSDVDPFHFWSQRKESLPILNSVALIVLATPIGFAAVDRIFESSSWASFKGNLEHDRFGLEMFFRYNN